MNLAWSHIDPTVRSESTAYRTPKQAHRHPQAVARDEVRVGVTIKSMQKSSGLQPTAEGLWPLKGPIATLTTL